MRLLELLSGTKSVGKVAEQLGYAVIGFEKCGHQTTYCILENPQTGLLKEQPFIIIMHGLPYQDIDYCKYGMPYGKRTRLWNNVFQWNHKQLYKKDSRNIIDTKHTATGQRGPCKGLPNNKFNQAVLNCT